MSDNYINHNPKPQGKHPSVPDEHEAQEEVDRLAKSSVSGKNSWASHQGKKGK